MEEKKTKIGFVDKTLGKITSRKLLVWGIATHMCYQGKITGEEWMYVSIVYIGCNVAMNWFLSMKKGIKVDK